MTIDTSKPQWKHDCDRCKFLGVTIGGGRLVDLYAHEHNELGNLTTLIARYGNDGPEYYSGHPEYVKPTGHAELWACYSLWIAQRKG